jgi:EmrB/QacA subfamily drug resistance transporter
MSSTRNHTSASGGRLPWTFAISSIALFMVVLDNLVVTTALPVIRTDLGASVEQLEWTVNAYTLTYAVLLISGAALGDRFGRKKVFTIGLGIFTVASAAAALAPDAGSLIAARAVQGIGGAIVTPLSLTILADAVGAERRGLALGAWSAVAGVAVAAGPVIGGAVVEGLSWNWIFWLNVPVGLVALPIAVRALHESFGEKAPLDLRGLTLASLGLLGIVWGLINGNADGWTSPQILAALGGGAALVAAFVAYEARTRAPMVPLRLFRNRTFSAVNAASLLMYFGMFGSVFLLTQFLQTAQGYSPLEAGVRVLPWTLVPMFIAPVAGVLADRIGGGPLIAGGLALQAASLGWLAYVAEPDAAYAALVGALVLGGIGNGLFYAPVASVVLGAVGRHEEGKASGINNAVRELGGVFGVAVLASVFAHQGGYASAQQFVDGMQPALWIGAAVVAVAAVVALAIGRPARAPEPVATPALALAD